MVANPSLDSQELVEYSDLADHNHRSALESALQKTFLELSCSCSGAAGTRPRQGDGDGVPFIDTIRIADLADVFTHCYRSWNRR